jgi:hypothetical protein
VFKEELEAGDFRRLIKKREMLHLDRNIFLAAKKNNKAAFMRLFFCVKELIII